MNKEIRVKEKGKALIGGNKQAKQAKKDMQIRQLIE